MFLQDLSFRYYGDYTICAKSLDPFKILSYYKKNGSLLPGHTVSIFPWLSLLSLESEEYGFDTLDWSAIFDSYEDDYDEGSEELDGLGTSE